MSWFRLDDQGAFHAKVVKAGNEAYGAWCRAGQWCSAHAQDGFIPTHVAHLIAPAKVWTRALAAGLLDPTDLDGYQVHDFNHYNPTKEEAEEKRQRLHDARSAAGRLGGLKSAAVRTGNKVQQPEALASSKPKQLLPEQTKQNEPPSRPVPIPKEESAAPSKSLVFEVAETYPAAVSAVTGQPYAIPHNQRLALNEVLAHRDGDLSPADWTRAVVREFLEATKDDRIGQGDRGPARLLAWLNGGRPKGPARVRGPADPPKSTAYEPFRGHGS